MAITDTGVARTPEIDGFSTAALLASQHAEALDAFISDFAKHSPDFYDPETGVLMDRMRAVGYDPESGKVVVVRNNTESFGPRGVEGFYVAEFDLRKGDPRPIKRDIKRVHQQITTREPQLTLDLVPTDTSVGVETLEIRGRVNNWVRTAVVGRLVTERATGTMPAELIVIEHLLTKRAEVAKGLGLMGLRETATLSR